MNISIIGSEVTLARGEIWKNFNGGLAKSLFVSSLMMEMRCVV
jgi:hypothetical protein